MRLVLADQGETENRRSDSNLLNCEKNKGKLENKQT